MNKYQLIKKERKKKFDKTRKQNTFVSIKKVCIDKMIVLTLTNR